VSRQDVATDIPPPAAPLSGWPGLEFRTVLPLSLLATAVLAAAGSLGDICMGDECVHVRHVRAYVEQGYRVPYDPLYDSPRAKPVPYSGTPLWHAGLALLWWLSGSESQTLAQVYHSLFYLVFVLSVYAGARRLWDQRSATWAWLLAATVPMVLLYSIVLYQDVPGLALVALATVLLWRRWFFWSGVCLAAGYMAKMNMLSLAPWAVVVAAWWAEGSWRRRLAAAAWVAGPVMAVFAYDMWWRVAVYGDLMKYNHFHFLMGGRPIAIKQASEVAVRALTSQPADYVRWKPFKAVNLTSHLTHFGIPLIVGIAAAVVRGRGRGCLWLWLALAFAVGGFLVVFVPTGCTQVRYLMPAVLPLVYLGGRGLGGVRLGRWPRWVLIAGAAVQAAAVVGYIAHQRRIDPNEKAGYAWIRENTPVDARIMYPERVLTNQTGRLAVWLVLNPANLMTEATDEERRAVLGYFRVTYIAVPMRRVYDRRREGAHAGGYERAFLQALAGLPYVEPVYANPGFRIFRVTLPEAPEGPSPPAPGEGASPAAPAPPPPPPASVR